MSLYLLFGVRRLSDFLDNSEESNRATEGDSSETILSKALELGVLAERNFLGDNVSLVPETADSSSSSLDIVTVLRLVTDFLRVTLSEDELSCAD